MNFFKLKHLIYLTVCLSFLVISPSQVQTVENTRFWMKIQATDKFQRSVIADTGVSIETTLEDYVIATGTLAELNAVKKLGWLETSFALTSAMDFPVEDELFHNYTELTEALQSLAAQHSDIMQLSSAGKSLEQREIWSVRVSGDLAHADELPGIIFMGGHHAREHVSVEMPLLLLKHLLEEYASGNTEVQNLVNSRDIHIIPAVNPDGLEYDVASGSYQMWRKNRRPNSNGTYGVDLNRNYSFKWGTGGSSTNPNSDTYMGPKPFSEPETQAIKNYVESHENITVLLSFHTFSELILYPWGHKYDPISQEQDRLVHQTMANKMAEWNRYTPQQSSGLYIASGDTVDWAYGTHGIIAFTIELDPKSMWEGGFYPGQDTIPKVYAKNINPAMYLIEYADNPYRVLTEPATSAQPATGWDVQAHSVSKDPSL